MTMDNETALNHMRHAANRRKWERRWFLLAHHVASWSKDPSTKVGAVVIGSDGHRIALGYNGFPPLIDDDPKRYADRPTKYLYTQHAERNALDNAAFDLRGGTIVCTQYPCVECTKSIISKGLVCVICPPRPEPLPGESSWRDTLHHSAAMLAEACVRVVELPAIEGDGAT